jgi:mono/diheme cytochrome c family protein
MLRRMRPKLSIGTNLNRLAMVSRCTQLAIGSLALCVASSAGAQETVEQGKTLYASYCVPCHKSPQRVTTSPGRVDLEKFLLEHYPATPESAAAIVAYLKGLEQHPIPRRNPKHRGEANPTQPRAGEPVPANAESKEDDPWSALKRLFQ